LNRSKRRLKKSGQIWSVVKISKRSLILLEIQSNPATMQLIRKSEEDIQCGRIKEISSVDDLLRECS
jgi:hypothetical protein